MAIGQLRYSKEEFAERGNEIYETQALKLKREIMVRLSPLISRQVPLNSPRIR